MNSTQSFWANLLNNRKQHPSLAINLLAFLGNPSPSKKQIQTIEAILLNVGLKAQLFFDSRLTPRETNCLTLAALGHTAAETAEILKISTRTVEQYRAIIKQKLGCKSMTQAVAQGIKYGYLEPKGRR